jgi:hypothetical protein
MNRALSVLILLAILTVEAVGLVQMIYPSQPERDDAPLPASAQSLTVERG